MNTTTPIDLSSVPYIYLTQELRRRGFAVAVFGPGELGEIDPRLVQDGMVREGAQVIETLE